MSNPEFESADDFLTALTHELVQHGAKSDKIDSFRRAAADDPELSLLAETAIDLRGAYEKHRQAGRHDDTSSTGVPSASARIFAIARPSVNSIGTFVGGVALMSVVWAVSSMQEPAGTPTTNRDSIAQGRMVAAEFPLPMTQAFPAFFAPENAMASPDLRMTQISADQWEVVKKAGDQRIAQEGSLDASLLVQTLGEKSFFASYPMRELAAHVSESKQTAPN